MSYYAHTHPLTESGIEPFEFAGFNWPRYVADMRRGSDTMTPGAAREEAESRETELHEED